jgi:hypothetical protein
MLGALSQLCVETASNFESALERQKEFDRTEARRQEEEQRRWEELVKEAAERVKQEKFRAMEREWQEIESAELALAAMKKVLCQPEIEIDKDEDDNDNDNVSQSATDEHVVSSLHLYFINSILTTEIDSIRKPSTRKKRSDSWMPAENSRRPSTPR